MIFNEVVILWHLFVHRPPTTYEGLLDDVFGIQSGKERNSLAFCFSLSPSVLNQYLKNCPKMFCAVFTGYSSWSKMFCAVFTGYSSWSKMLFPLLQSRDTWTFSWNTGTWWWAFVKLLYCVKEWFKFFFFEILSDLNLAVLNHLADESQTRWPDTPPDHRQTRVKRVSRIHHRTILRRESNALAGYTTGSSSDERQTR